jgi:RimJ/RimL family protein N-acetyltransferase
MMERPTLTGEMIVLRPLVETDADALLDLATDAEGRRLVGRSDEVSMLDVRRRIEESATAPDRIELAIRTSTDDECLGEIALTQIDGSSALLTLAMRPAYRSRGYGTEAVTLLLRHAFDGLGLHRVGLRFPAVNQRAQAMHENLGFVVEGRQRDAFRDGDGWCDAIVMGMLVDEYRTSVSELMIGR